MDGYTDHPFRKLVRKMGAGCVYTEFINGMDVVHKNPYLEKRLFFEEIERPIAYQVYDEDPDRLIKAVYLLMKRSPDFIDINMGCAEKSIAGRGAGVGLMRNPEKIEKIFSILSKELDLPITGKIRLGWDSESMNYLQIAKIVEDNGGKMIAIHPRTKKQYFEGKADWEAISQVRKIVTIPVVGNGDVKVISDIKLMQESTLCDAIMIGRGAIGNPWLFTGIDKNQVPDQEIKDIICLHAENMTSFYGIERGLVTFRKHLTRYLSIYTLTEEQRHFLLTCIELNSFLEAIQKWDFKRSSMVNGE